MMLSTLAILLLGISANVYAKSCDGTCRQGEGDCDRDSDCVDGLICVKDWWWWSDDYCEAGPDTTNFEWESWGDWSDCIGSCGGVGTKTRHRECTPPSYGGYECPAATDSEVGECEMAPCPIDCQWGEWVIGECSETCGDGTRSNTREKYVVEEFGGSCDGSATIVESCNAEECPPPSNTNCNPKTWEAYNKECCTPEGPCGLGEGDCDEDADCFGDLVCGKNNCLRNGSGFNKKSDCCALPVVKGSGNPNCDPSGLATWLVDDVEKNWMLKECCSEENPCGPGQGDCDMDSECEGYLKCGDDNCGPTFYDERTDCCE